MNNTKTQVITGISCPSCGANLRVSSGIYFIRCEFCNTTLIVETENNIKKFYVKNEISSKEVSDIIKKWFTKGIKKAGDLVKKAIISERILVFIPFWRKKGILLGVVAGKIEKHDRDNKIYYVNKTFFEEIMLDVNRSACDIEEFGVYSVNLKGDILLPFDINRLDSEGATFEITSAQNDIDSDYKNQLRTEKLFIEQKLDRLNFKKWYQKDKNIEIVYYPLWVVKYLYSERLYQIVIDGEDRSILSGRAPGSNVFRAGIFTFLSVIAINGAFFIFKLSFTTLMTEKYNSKGLAIIISAVIICFGVFYWGYRKFRYGEEVIIGDYLS